MGYQEFIIKTSENTLKEDIQKISNIFKHHSLYGKVLNVIPNLKTDVEFRKQSFYKNDIFLCITGDRHGIEYLLKPLHMPLYPLDDFVVAAVKQNKCKNLHDYETLFQDIPVHEYFDLELDIDNLEY